MLFMMFASLKEGVKKGVGDLPVVREFSDVFSDDIIDLPSEEKWSLSLIWCHEQALFRLRSIGCLCRNWVSSKSS